VGFKVPLGQWIARPGKYRGREVQKKGNTETQRARRKKKEGIKRDANALKGKNIVCFGTSGIQRAIALGFGLTLRQPLFVLDYPGGIIWPANH
jgi:hypothetical protein